MSKKILFLITFCLCLNTFGQNKLILEIENIPETIKVDKLQGYLGKFVFSYQNKEYTILNEYKLVDWINQPELYFQDIQLGKLTSLSFDLGVDSIQTLKGAMEGDLDPGNGMFWTWQSGYINFKLEYKEDGSEKNFHIGGYQGKHNSVCRITMNIPKGKLLKGISFDVNEFTTFIESKKISSVMSPGEKAVMIANQYNSFIKPIIE